MNGVCKGSVGAGASGAPVRTGAPPRSKIMLSRDPWEGAHHVLKQALLKPCLMPRNGLDACVESSPRHCKPLAPPTVQLQHAIPGQEEKRSE